MNAVAIIPARGGSKRLPRKNVLPVLGKPLVAWAIEAAQGSRYIGPGGVFVSTEDEEIAAVARAAGAEAIQRPAALSGDAVWTEPVIRHAVEHLEAAGRVIELVMWMNACAPEVTPADVDYAFDRLLNENLREVFSVDEALRSNSIVRALRRETLAQNSLSVKCGVVILNYVDIHTAADLQAAEARLLARQPAKAPVS